MQSARANLLLLAACWACALLELECHVSSFYSGLFAADPSAAASSAAVGTLLTAVGPLAVAVFMHCESKRLHVCGRRLDGKAERSYKSKHDPTGSSIGAAPLTISTFLAGAALISIPSAALFRPSWLD